MRNNIMAKAASTTTSDADKAARQKAIEKAKYQATAKIVAENKDTWNSLVQEDLRGQGIDWSAPLTAEQKAQQEFDRLLAEHPSLAQRLNADVALDIPA